MASSDIITNLFAIVSMASSVNYVLVIEPEAQGQNPARRLISSGWRKLKNNMTIW